MTFNHHLKVMDVNMLKNQHVCNGRPSTISELQWSATRDPVLLAYILSDPTATWGPQLGTSNVGPSIIVYCLYISDTYIHTYIYTYILNDLGLWGAGWSAC